jgi:hypothetical protein
VGDSLRRSIEKGLKERKKCILILSPYFFSNTGWSRTEFDSAFTRQILEGSDVVLPVWYGVTKQQVYEYSPSLLDRFGVSWDEGVDEVVRKLYNAIEWGSCRDTCNNRNEAGTTEAAAPGSCTVSQQPILRPLGEPGAFLGQFLND